MSDLVEIMARVIGEHAGQRPWADMALDRVELRRLIRNSSASYDINELTQGDCRQTALAALRAIEGAGMKVVGREPSEGMVLAMSHEMDVPTVIIFPEGAVKSAWQAAFDAALAFGDE